MQLKQKCPICSQIFSYSKTVYGPDVVYTKNISLGESTLSTCKKCNFVINKSYKSIDFRALDYSNIDVNLVEDSHDDIVLAQIKIAFHQFFNTVQKQPICIEMGAGKRLSLISSINKSLNIESYAIDPIYGTKKKFEKINLLNSLDQLDKSTNQNIFIARNCLEYFEPKKLQEILNRVLAEESLICFELQSFDELKWGATFYFREYSCFYSKLAINKIIEQSGWNVKWLSALEISGDERITYLGYVTKKNSNTNLVYFENIHNLIEVLRQEKNKKDIYLWGAGGRGLSFLFNDGKFLIDKVIDSSIERQGINIDQYGDVIAPDEIPGNSIIVLLNSRFLHLIPDSIKSINQIFLVS